MFIPTRKLYVTHTTINTHGETITTSNQDVDKIVDVEMYTHGGNEWIYDDYLCSSLIFNKLL